MALYVFSYMRLHLKEPRDMATLASISSLFYCSEVIENHMYLWLPPEALPKANLWLKLSRPAAVE